MDLHGSWTTVITARPTSLVPAKLWPEAPPAAFAPALSWKIGPAADAVQRSSGGNQVATMGFSPHLCVSVCVCIYMLCYIAFVWPIFAILVILVKYCQLMSLVPYFWPIQTGEWPLLILHGTDPSYVYGRSTYHGISRFQSIWEANIQNWWAVTSAWQEENM